LLRRVCREQRLLLQLRFAPQLRLAQGSQRGTEPAQVADGLADGDGKSFEKEEPLHAAHSSR
jgi:hypothetical protein